MKLNIVDTIRREGEKLGIVISKNSNYVEVVDYAMFDELCKSVAYSNLIIGMEEEDLFTCSTRAFDNNVRDKVLYWYNIRLRGVLVDTRYSFDCNGIAKDKKS